MTCVWSSTCQSVKKSSRKKRCPTKMLRRRMKGRHPIGQLRIAAHTTPVTLLARRYWHDGICTSQLTWRYWHDATGINDTGTMLLTQCYWHDGIDTRQLAWRYWHAAVWTQLIRRYWYDLVGTTLLTRLQWHDATGMTILKHIKITSLITFDIENKHVNLLDELKEHNEMFWKALI